MKALLTILALAILLAAVSGTASGKSIKAYCNGQEATVSGVVLPTGEQFTIDLYITPDQESYAYAEIDEPGITRAYDRISGDDLTPHEFRPCNASNTAHYQWVMSANENWLHGTAPLNIYYQINERGNTDPCASGLFTVVEAYIVPGEPSDKPAAGAAEKVSATGFTTSVTCVVVAAIALARKRC